MARKIKKTSILDDEGGFYRKQQIDYQRVVMAHIMSMSKLTCWIPYLTQMDLNPNINMEQLRTMNYESLKTGVIFMEALLSPYFDQKYLTAVGKLDKDVKKWDLPEHEIDKKASLDKFALLVQLMGRRNLLLEEKVTALIE